jgi:Xaa-Pro aminopeptidase
MDYKKRALKLAQGISAKDQIGCVMITSLPNLRYFFNYSGVSFERFSCGLLTKDGTKTALIVPKLDEAKAEKSAAQNIHSWSDSEGYSGALESAISDLGITGNVVGCELGITLAQMNALKANTGASNFIPITEEISRLRIIKDEEEIEDVRKTARALGTAYKHLADSMHPGDAEIEVGLEIQRFLAKKVAEVSFCAVQSGSNSAIPHAQVSSKKIKRGDMIVVDVSCSSESGYFADFTRTFVAGKPSENQKKIYELVKKAQAAALKVAGAGKVVEEVDKAARNVIAKEGFGEYFIHRTGHGLGLEVHEPPWINDGNLDKLERGMIFTIEPGIYLPGKFGVRIEDNVVIDKEGATNITPLSHELVEI